jgi:multisubunit Na+/H+ antiporter MnhC subunit
MKKIKALCVAVFFVLSIYLVAKGQSIKSYFGLTIMLIGLFGILFELYLYNRKST